MIYGLIGEEIIQFNEKSLWSGGPKPDETNYNGGNYTNRYPFLVQIRKYLTDGDYEKAQKLAEEKLIGPQSEKFGMYLSFGELRLNFLNQSKKLEETKDFSRVLDINRIMVKLFYFLHCLINGIQASLKGFVQEVDL